MRAHRQAQALRGRNLLQHLGGQAAGLWAEQERIAVGEGGRIVAGAAAGTQGEQAARSDGLQRGVQRSVDLQACVFVVVQAGAFELLVLELEAERLDQVQLGAGVGAKADGIAGVGRYFGLEQQDMQRGRGGHRRSLRAGAGQASPAQRAKLVVRS